MITVHHLNNSRSQRILWLLEELEVPYEIKKYQRDSEHLAPPELKAVHPLGKSPVITDSDGNVTLAESGAIIEYLIGKYGKGKFDPTEEGKIDNLYFTHYAEGSLMPILVNKLIFTIIPQRAPFFIRPLLNIVFGEVDKKFIIPGLTNNLKMLEAHLAKSTNPFFTGPHLTSADFQLVFPIEALLSQSRGAAPIETPKLKEWMKHVAERPAYKHALEKGGKYDYAVDPSKL